MLSKLYSAFVLAGFLVITVAGSISGAESSTTEGVSFPLAKTVILDSSPSDATIWKKTGKKFECINIKTPCSVNLTFRSKHGVKKLFVKKFGYVTQEVLIRSTDTELKVKLEKKPLFPNPDEGASSQLRKICGKVTKAVNAFITANNQDPFSCCKFEFVEFGVNDHNGKPFFDIVIALDQDFGGREFRKITRMRNKQQRRQHLAKEILSQAVADVLVEIRDIIGKNSGLKGLSVTAFFTTSKKVLTEHPEYFLKTYTHDYGSYIEFVTVRHQHEKTAVNELKGFGFAAFHMSLSKIPKTKEPKLVAERVMQSADIFVKDNSDADVIQLKAKSSENR